MNDAQVLVNLQRVLPAGDLDRIQVANGEDGETEVRVDLHMLKYNSGKALVQNIILLNPGVEFQLDIIHGYNSGMVLKKMVNQDIKNKRIVTRYSPMWNPGETIMEIAA